MTPRFLSSALAALLLSLAAGAARAQSPARESATAYSFPDDEPAAAAAPARQVGVEKGYSYDFADDPLTAQGMEATGAILRVRPRGLRATLTKPRLHFVPQLLRSVEDL